MLQPIAFTSYALINTASLLCAVKREGATGRPDIILFFKDEAPYPMPFRETCDRDAVWNTLTNLYTGKESG